MGSLKKTMTEGIPFKPKTDIANEVFDESLKKQIIPKVVDIKLLCPVLGPGKDNPNATKYPLRVVCKEVINELGHTSFFLEDLSVKQAIEYLKKENLKEKKGLI